MLAQTQNIYNSQIVHLALIPKWHDHGVELSLREIEKVKEFYLANPDLNFADCSDRLSLENFDSGGFMVCGEKRILNRPCEISLAYYASSGLWDAGIIAKIDNLRDSADPRGFCEPVGQIFGNYFRVSGQVFSNVARL